MGIGCIRAVFGNDIRNHGNAEGVHAAVGRNYYFQHRGHADGIRWKP